MASYIWVNGRVDFTDELVVQGASGGPPLPPVAAAPPLIVIQYPERTEIYAQNGDYVRTVWKHRKGYTQHYSHLKR